MQSLTPYLDLLQPLLPPSHITLVGAGSGQGQWAQWLAKQKISATLMEADAQRFQALQRQHAAGSWPQARLLEAVLAPEAGAVEFFSASLPAESGLLPAQDLQPLWPNLHTLQVRSLPAQPLSALLADSAHQWLVLDCLPAAPLLQSAGSALDALDVILARVVLAQAGQGAAPAGCSLDAVAQALPGFKLLGQTSSRHPGIGHALFVRDYPSAHAQALKKQDLQAHAQKALEADLAASNKAKDAETQAKQAALQARDEQAKATQALQTQLQQAQQQNAELLKEQELQAQTLQGLETDLAAINKAKDAETQAKQAALQARDEQAKAKEGLQTQLQQAQQQNAELLKKQELQAQALQGLEADLAASKKAKDAETQAKQAALQARDEQAKAKEGLQAQLQQAQQQNAELIKKQEQQAQTQQALQADLNEYKAKQQESEYREALVQQEMAKVEAQMELLKELLLEEKQGTTE